MNRYIRMVKQFVLDPKVRFGYLTRDGFYNHMSDEEYRVNINCILVRNWTYKIPKPLTRSSSG